MPQNDVQFIRTNGLGRRSLSNDHISGIMFYTDTLPAGFTLTDNIKPLLSLQDAEDLGIVDTHADETVATGGNVEITAAGAEGNVESIYIDGVLLGSYTIESGDAASDVATGLRAAINALTLKHGFVAAGSTANVALTSPSKLGIVPNTATISFTSSGTGTATVTQFSSGAGSFYSVMHYHISEFFRQKSDGKLWVGLFPSGTFDASEVADMRTASGGEIRQIAVYINASSFATSLVTLFNTSLVTAREDHENLLGILHADMTGLTLSTLSNLASLTASKVSVNAGEDGNFHYASYSRTKAYIAGDKFKWLNKTYVVNRAATGQEPYDTNYFSEVSVNLPDIVGYSVGTLGNQLGCIAKASVNESIANPERFPLVDGNNLSVAGFATGDLYKDISKSLRNQLNDYHYTYLREFSGDSGVYYNDSYTCISRANDYATIENNRTMDKAERVVYIALIPKLVGDVVINEDGTLAQETINEYHTIVDGQLDTMQANGEISQKQVSIDNTQNVLSTDNLDITMQLIPKGKARNITVNNSYVLKLS